MKVMAIVPAAGLGVRMGTERRKPLVELDGVPILIWTLRKLAACTRIGQMFVAVRKEDFAVVEAAFTAEPYRARVTLVEGGDYRQDSVAAALAQLPADTDLVVVHDAVRPFVAPALIEKVLEAAAKDGAAIAALPVTDTVKQIDRTRVSGTLPRERIALAQTPQAFRYDLLKEAFARAEADGYHGSDEAVLVERLGHPVAVVAGSDRNIKITKPADLELARFLLGQEGSREREK